jgi:RNA polymerase sigma factor (sigma-70 family)
MRRSLSGRARGFDHYFGANELPKQIEGSRLIELVQELKAGDKSIAPVIVEGHIRLAMWLVACYANRYPHKTDDLVSAACLGVAQAVEWAPDRLLDDNITPYIFATAERHIKDFLEQDRIVKIPRSAYREMRIKGDFIPTIIEADGIKFDDDNPIDIYDILVETIPACEDNYDFIFVELINSMGLSPKEKQIIEMTIQGYIEEEIGAAIGCSHQRVNQHKNIIGEKLLRRKDDFSS